MCTSFDAVVEEYVQWSRESLEMYICVVQCIAQSVSQPRYRHAQLTRCFSAVAELLSYRRETARQLRMSTLVG